MKTKIRKFPKMGRGLVATKNFKKGQVVESSHVVVMNKLEHKELVNTILNLYVFAWGDGGCVALALGNGSLFNHSDEQNVTYYQDYKNNKIVFRATKNIKKGEQLFINYGYDPVFYYSDYLKKREKIMENQR